MDEVGWGKVTHSGIRRPVNYVYANCFCRHGAFLFSLEQRSRAIPGKLVDIYHPAAYHLEKRYIEVDCDGALLRDIYTYLFIRVICGLVRAHSWVRDHG